MVTKNGILESLTSFKNSTEKEINNLSDNDFPNPLDYTFAKSKKEGYLSVMNETIVLLNKSEDVISFSVGLHKRIDQNISVGKVKDNKLINVGILIIDRRNLPDGEETGGVIIDEKTMAKKGMVSGKISAYTDLANYIDNLDGKSAKDNAHKNHPDKMIVKKN